jgi:ribosome-associated protein
MSRWRVPPGEVDFAAVRSQGPGGQNVNKVSSAAQLRFDIATSSLSQLDKEKLRVWADQRINREGTVVIKAQSQRSLAANQADALSRLQALIDRALQPWSNGSPPNRPVLHGSGGCAAKACAARSKHCGAAAQLTGSEQLKARSAGWRTQPPTAVPRRPTATPSSEPVWSSPYLKGL